jgi:hypothetical protein
VLDHAHGDLRDVEHLPPDHPGRWTIGGQRASAAGAGARLVHHHLIGPLDLPQRAALVPWLPAGLAPGPAAQRHGRRLVQPVARRRLRRVPRGGGQLPLQLRDARILLDDPRVLRGQAGVLHGEPVLQLGDRPRLRRHERRQLLVGRSGHRPILHTPRRSSDQDTRTGT